MYFLGDNTYDKQIEPTRPSQGCQPSASSRTTIAPSKIEQGKRERERHEKERERKTKRKERKNERKQRKRGSERQRKREKGHRE